MNIDEIFQEIVKCPHCGHLTHPEYLCYSMSSREVFCCAGCRSDFVSKYPPAGR